MPPETEHRLDALLKSCAQKRREEAGGDFDLHPATRRLLLGEVARSFPKRKGAPIRWRFILPRVWGRTISLAGLLFMVGLTAWAIKTVWGNLPTIDDVTATPKGQFAFSLRKQASEETNTVPGVRTNASHTGISDLALLNVPTAQTASGAQEEQRHARTSMRGSGGTREVDTGRVTSQAIPAPSPSAPSVARNESSPGARQDSLPTKGANSGPISREAGSLSDSIPTGTVAAKGLVTSSEAPHPPNPVESKVTSGPQSIVSTSGVRTKPSATETAGTKPHVSSPAASALAATKPTGIQELSASRPVEPMPTIPERVTKPSADKLTETLAVASAPVVALPRSRQASPGFADPTNLGVSGKHVSSEPIQDLPAKVLQWRFASLGVTAPANTEKKREQAIPANDSDLALRSFSVPRQVRPTILTRFEFKRNGTNVTLVDADGSTYEGEIIPNVPSAITPGLSEDSSVSPDVARRLGGLAVGLETASKSANSAPKPSKLLFSFKVSGRNITLGQPVLVIGSIYDETETPSTSSEGHQRLDNASGRDLRRELRFEGNYRVAEGTEEAIQASQVN